MLNNKVFVDDGEALYFHRGVSSRKRGANGKAIRDYPPIEVAVVTRWKETFAAINEGRRVIWARFLSLLRIHRVTAEFCTCPTYSTLRICDGILLWLLVKEPGFTVLLRYSWKYVGVRPFRYGFVRQTTRVEPPHVREFKSQARPAKKGGRKRLEWLLRTTPLVTVAVMENSSPSAKTRRVSWPAGTPPGTQCACTVHRSLAVNAIGPCIFGASTATGAFTTWLD